MSKGKTVAFWLLVLMLCDVISSAAQVRADDVTHTRAELRERRQQRRRERERMRRLRANRRHDDRATEHVTSQQHDFSDFNPYESQPEVTRSQEERNERARLRKAMEARER